MARQLAGWTQPFPGWGPPVDDGPRPLQAARSVGRWWWPTVTVGGFLAVAVQVFGHEGRATGLAGLFTVALAATVVVLLTIHRRNGPARLARMVAEYAVVALLAVLLTAPAGIGGQQPADHSKPTKDNHAPAKPDAKPKRAEAEAGDDQPAVLRAAAKAVRAVTGAAGWLVDLWRQADRNTKAIDRQAMAVPARSPAPSVLSLWRSP